jgi:hypothetical protein
MSNRIRDNRFFLLKTVFPFLQKMPTKEDLINGKTEVGAAICNLGSYIDHHDARTAPEEIDGEYHCGRIGCLAGWYVMLSDRDGRLGAFERAEIAGYDNDELAQHFGLQSYSQSESLFSALGGGVEDTQATTRRALRERKKRLREIMEAQGDFEAMKGVKKKLHEYRVYGF